MAKHPPVTFEEAVVVRTLALRDVHGTLGEQHVWWVIGRVEQDAPFLLIYQDPGLTSWICESNLGDGLRKKILTHLRALRYASEMPGYVKILDLVSEGLDTLKACQAATEAAFLEFFNKTWRAKYLDDFDEDWVDLDVPFEDRSQVKELGQQIRQSMGKQLVTWSAQTKRWRINARKIGDTSAFSKWLRTSAAT